MERDASHPDLGHNQERERSQEQANVPRFLPVSLAPTDPGCGCGTQEPKGSRKSRGPNVGRASLGPVPPGEEAPMEAPPGTEVHLSVPRLPRALAGAATTLPRLAGPRDSTGKRGLGLHGARGLRAARLAATETPLGGRRPGSKAAGWRGACPGNRRSPPNPTRGPGVSSETPQGSSAEDREAGAEAGAGLRSGDRLGQFRDRGTLSTGASHPEAGVWGSSAMGGPPQQGPPGAQGPG